VCGERERENEERELYPIFWALKVKAEQVGGTEVGGRRSGTKNINC
jgi:hypothetical protein